MDNLIKFLEALNSLSPLAIIGLLGTVIFLLVKGKTSVDDKVAVISDNHLHGVQESLDRLLETLQRIEVDMKGEFSYLRARMNGRDK